MLIHAHGAPAARVASVRPSLPERELRAALSLAARALLRPVVLRALTAVLLGVAPLALLAPLLARLAPRAITAAGPALAVPLACLAGALLVRAIELLGARVFRALCARPGCYPDRHGPWKTARASRSAPSSPRTSAYSAPSTRAAWGSSTSSNS